MSKSETVLSSASVMVTWEMLQPFVEFDSQELLSQYQRTVNLRTTVTRWHELDQKCATSVTKWKWKNMFLNTPSAFKYLDKQIALPQIQDIG